MNERNKDFMLKQQKKIIEVLESDFAIPIDEDELGVNETPDELNNFLIVYGDFMGTGSIGQLNQEIYVIYVSENNPNLETMSIDVISSMDKVPGIEFVKTIKRRTPKKDTDNYIDQITFVFKRLVKYDRNIPN